MKIRKQVRALHKTLCHEASVNLHDHPCNMFLDNGGKCVLCVLLEIRKIFAAIHLAREKGLHPTWFESERSLYELLGEKTFFNKIEIELKEVANFPRKQCTNCGHIVTFFHCFKKLARSQRRRKTIDCGYCGDTVELTELPILPPSKEKIKIKEDMPPRLRPRSPRAVAHKELGVSESLEKLGLSLINPPKVNAPPIPTPAPAVPILAPVTPFIQPANPAFASAANNIVEIIGGRGGATFAPHPGQIINHDQIAEEERRRQEMEEYVEYRERMRRAQEF